MNRIRLFCLTLFWLLLPFPAFSASLTREPQLLEPVKAEYSAQAQAAGVSGDVVLEIDISETGSVTNAQVLESPGYGLDQSALAAAKKLRFSPAEIDGKPAPVRIEYRFHFEIKPNTVDPPKSPKTPVVKPVNFRGRVVERGSKRPLVGAMVDINDGSVVVITDSQGNFQAAGIPVGPARIVVVESSHLRFKTTETIEKGKATEVTYYLQKAKQGIFETIVIGEKEKKEVSLVKISAAEINRIAGISGDTVKVIQNLPGAARTSFGSDSLILRGGNPHDTKVYVDGIEVPMIFHFGGVTSVYSSELTKDVEYEPGNFGVQYGRATAGRVEIKSRDPHSKQLHLLSDLNFYHATALAEGPLSENVSVAIAARRSYVDSLLNQINVFDSDSTTAFSLAPRYYDGQLKLTWTPRKNDAIRFHLFGSDDGMGLVGMKQETQGFMDDLNIKTRFFRAMLSWDHKLAQNTRLKVIASQGYDRVIANVGNRMRQDLNVLSTIVRADAHHELSKYISFGLGFDGRFERWNVNITSPHIPKTNEIPNPIDLEQQAVLMDEIIPVWLPGVWAEAVVEPMDGLVLIPGIRFDYGTFYNSSWFDPRISARWTITENTTLKGGAGIYHQFPEPVYVTKQYGNPDLGSEGSRQYSAGIEQHIWGPITADVQLYYKDLFGLTEPSNNIIVRDGELVEERYNNSGGGKAYGAEFLLRYNADGRFFGWLSYTYSKTKRDSSNIGIGDEDVSGDQYDQPHNLTAVGTLELPEIWNGLSAGFRLSYGSGNPYRKIENAIFDADGGSFNGIQSKDWNARLPDFFQLDLRIDKKWTFKTWSFAAYLEAKNVTNRKNADEINYNYDYSKSSFSAEFPPTILPSFGLRAEY